MLQDFLPLQELKIKTENTTNKQTNKTKLQNITKKQQQRKVLNINI